MGGGGGGGGMMIHGAIAVKGPLEAVHNMQHPHPRY